MHWEQGRSSGDGSLGDWVGAVITPWFINLFILPGGGNLWSDRRSGERCQITFPIGPLEFIADDDPSAVVPAYQYCPLFAPPSQFASQAAAGRGPAARFRRNFAAKAGFGPACLPSPLRQTLSKMDGATVHPPSPAFFLLW
jgi:hypothetical protein